MSIPKVIHYCWFGKNPKTEKEKKCIESWRKNCPNYKIVEWNEDNYDINGHPFMAEAYRKGKWAFVSDYARLDIINKNGGVYLDTDVEIIKPFDDLLDCEMFVGFQNTTEVAFGLGFGAQKEHPYLKEIMQEYDTIQFPTNEIDLSKISCPIIQSKVLMRHGLIQNGLNQDLDKCKVFSEEYFSPKSFITGEVNVTPNTYSIHHFNMSWFSSDAVELREKEWELRKQNKSTFYINLILFLKRVKKFPKKIKKRFNQGGIKGIVDYLKQLVHNTLDG